MTARSARSRLPSRLKAIATSASRALCRFGGFIRRHPTQTAFTVLFLMALWMLISIPRPNVLMSLEVETESFDVTVLNPAEMRLQLPRLVSTSAPDNCLESVSLNVAQGTMISFSRAGSGDVFVTTLGATRTTGQDGTTTDHALGDTFRVPAAGYCAWTGNLRLPAVGQLSAGTAISGSIEENAFFPLTEGEITLYGRATNRLFGIPVNWLPSVLLLEADKLYLAQELTIPPGSQISGNNARFWGYADINMKAGSGMTLHASTNAREILLIAPAPKVSGKRFDKQASSLEPDRISLPRSAVLFEDPNIQTGYWLLIGLAGLFAYAGNIIRTFVSRQAD